MIRCRIIPLLLWTCVILFVQVAHSANQEAQPTVSAPSAPAPAIVIFFVGGPYFHFKVQHPLQLNQKLRAAYGDQIRVAMFNNHQRKAAHRAILEWLDTRHEGKLSDAEKRGARIMLLGHSWGGPALMSLARELQREDIPVLLTVQIDSVSKLGQNDRLVPANVAKAANFFQVRGILHGRSAIVAADPSRTEILGDFRFHYDTLPAGCHDYPVLAHFVFRYHIAIECDPQIWSRIEALIDANMPPVANQLQSGTGGRR